MVDEDFEDDIFDEGGGIDLDEELDELEDLEELEELDEDEGEVLASDDSGDEVVEESLEAASDGPAEPESFDDDFDETGAGLPPTATFDGDDEDDDEVVVLDPDDDDDEDDAVREGEFVCRSCFMAKRESALADEERMLCLDCV